MLIKNNLVVEARIIARSILENCFIAISLEENGVDFVEKLIEDDRASKNKLGKLILNRPKSFDAGQRLAVEKRMFKVKAEQAQTPVFLNPKQIAENGRLSELYIIYSDLSADGVHVSLSGLDRYCVKNELEGLDYFIIPEMSDADVALIFGAACLGVIELAVSVNNILDGKLRGAGSIEQARHRQREYFARG